MHLPLSIVIVYKLSIVCIIFDNAALIFEPTFPAP